MSRNVMVQTVEAWVDILKGRRVFVHNALLMMPRRIRQVVIPQTSGTIEREASDPPFRVLVQIDRRNFRVNLMMEVTSKIPGASISWQNVGSFVCKPEQIAEEGQRQPHFVRFSVPARLATQAA